MTTHNLESIREAVAGTGDSVLVILVPAARVAELFGKSAPAGPAFTADLTVPQYREQFEPRLSDSRIREMCAAGAFPDSTAPDGEVVPGAYKDMKGEWRITHEGIVARQRYEREQGLRKREEATEEKLAEAEVAAAAKGTSEKRPSANRSWSRSLPSRSGAASRPNRGSWERHMKGAGS